MARAEIPSFYLYGEAPQLVRRDFVHVEELDDRSRPSEWTIQPHAHAGLNHIFIVLSGGGAMKADGTTISFASPAFLLVPATTVHGFEWLHETSGFVVTAATSFIADLNSADESLAALFARPQAVSLDADSIETMQHIVTDLARELNWSSPGHRAAVNAAMLSLLVIAIRSQGINANAATGSGPHATTVARFREQIEKRFRLREPICNYASSLGISETALRSACAKVAGRSPGAMLDERALMEAQRALLYTNLAISEIGFALGFADPTYFSRFFRRKVGLSAREYRALQRTHAD